MDGESGIPDKAASSFNPFASQLAPDYKEQWQRQVRMITQSYFRGYFGMSKYNRWGHYIERQMSPTISHFSDWIDYLSDDVPLYSHDNRCRTLAMSDDGRYIFTGADDNVIICYDMIKLDIVKQWSMDIFPRPLVYKCGLLAAPSGEKIVIFDGHTLEQKKQLTGHTAYVQSLSFNNSGDSILSSGEDNTIRMWSVDSGECTRVFTSHTDYCGGAVFLGDLIISGSDDRSLKVWNTDSGECIQDITAGITQYVSSLVVNCDETLVGCRVLANGAVVYKTDDYSLAYSKEGFFSSVIFHPFRPDILLVSDRRTHSIWIVNIHTDDVLHKLEGHKDHITWMCFTPDASRLVSVCADKTVRIWNISSMI